MRLKVNALLAACFLLTLCGLHLKHEDGGNMVLRNVRELSSCYGDMSGQHPANAVDVHIQEESTNHNHGSE
jgi:outer membrane lipopolysaccharide assembly protein LptE/RlpB